MKKILLFVLGFVFYSCTPGACECLELIDDKQSRLFGNNDRTGFQIAETVGDCYAKFSPEKYQKYTAADEWEKQARHAKRMQPLAEAKMREECD